MSSCNATPLVAKIKKLYPFVANNNFFLFSPENLKVAIISEDLYRFIVSAINEPSASWDIESYNIYLEELLSFVKGKSMIPRRRDEATLTDEHLQFKNLRSLQDLTLVVCEDCNLRCEYCYLIENLDKKTYMDNETCRNALKLFFEHAQGPVHISFYGGEPLLNFDIIKQSTAYASELAKNLNIPCSFGIVTNGTICNNEIFTFLNNNRFIVNISLDGPPKIHNRFRRFKSGKPTFEVILNNIKKYYAYYTDKRLIRFSPSVAPEYYSSINYLYDFFKKLERDYGISFNVFGDLKCIEGREEFKIATNKNYFDMLFKYAELILKDIKAAGNWIDCFTNVRIPIEFFKRIFVNKSISSNCGAGVKSMVVYPGGNITGCRQLDPAICRGLNLSWGNVFSKEYDDRLRLKSVIASISLPDRCAECFLKNICPGFCPAYAYHSTGNFNDPDPFICETQKTFFKISMWLVAKALELGIPITKDLLLHRISYGGRD